MFRVVTRNSIYTVQVTENGFRVRRTGDTWGRAVTERHEHFSSTLRIAIGAAMVTTELVTSPVVAVLPN